MSNRFTLKNGLPVHLVPFAGTEAVTLLVLTKVGSRYEYPEISGASHFIEHLMFKGTKKRPSTAEITRMLDAVGAEYNAYTGKDMTGYHITIQAGKLKLAIDLLHDMLFHSVYDPKELDRERGVIIEEINMYKDSPMMHVDELLEEALFEGNTLGWDIAGSHHTMKTMKRDNIIAYRDSHYVPSRMTVSVAGKVDARTKTWLANTFGKVRSPKEVPEAFAPFTVADRAASRFEKKKTQQLQVAMGFPSFGIADKRNAALALMSTILGGSMSSRLFLQVRERRGLAYFIRASNSPYEDVGAFAIQAGLDPSRLPLAVKTIREQVSLMRKKGVSAIELREAKEHIRGKTLLKLEDSAERAEWYARQELFYDRIQTPEDRLRAIAKVTAKEVQQVADAVLNEKRMCWAAIGPHADKKAFAKEAGF